MIHRFGKCAWLSLLFVPGLACNSGEDPSTPGFGTQASSEEAPAILVADPHQDGRAKALGLVEARSGRLVDVYALDVTSGARELVLEDVLIGARIVSDGVDFELEVVHGTQQEELTILHPAASEPFVSAVRRAHAAREWLDLRVLAAHELPPFPVVPRNAAIELTFDDLLDPATVGGRAVELWIGRDHDEPFAARVLSDPNHGTRLIVDLAVSPLEAALSDPPLAINPLGLPAATSRLVANVALTLPVAGDGLAGLANLAGRGLAATSNAPIDAERGALAIAFRSGGPSDLTGDVSMGFLGDAVAPSVIGELRVDLSGALTGGPAGSNVIVIPRLDWTTSCSTSPKAGDLLSAPGFQAVVVSFSAQDANGVDKLRVRIVQSNGSVPVPGPALLSTAFDPNIDDPGCFVRFTPGPTSPPVDGVPIDAVVRLKFSEPMASESLTPFDNFRISEVSGDPNGFELVVGDVLPSPDLTRSRFIPSLPFAHTPGNSESYFVQLAGGPEGPTDLAGNPLAAALPTVEFKIDPAQAAQLTEGVVFRFSSPDELYNDGFPELRGQFTYDLEEQVILPRPISRFPISADRDKPLPNAMTPFAPGTQTPLTPLGSKLHSLWRYVDFGFSADDETNYNVDIEGLSWAPVGGQVIADQYSEFQMSLGHASFQPDEVLNPMTGFPAFPDSGLVDTYADNLLAGEPADGTIVHPKACGYVVNPGDLFTGVSGTQLMPWPLNQGIPLDQFEYYTWRDTALQETAAPFGAGVPLAQEVDVLGLPVLPGSIYAAGMVPTVALPLLMEFRCYPDPTAIGVNSFDVSLAANTSVRPNFRAFSSGGFNTSGQAVLIDPDNQPTATGGFNPSSTPPGAATLPSDNLFYIGQADLITRVSRVHTIWLPAAGAALAQPVVEADVPGSSQVLLAFRGATAIAGAAGAANITTDAGTLDAYGDPMLIGGIGAPDFLNGDATWQDDISGIDGSSWFQCRVTFIGDAAMNLTAALDSLGFASEL